MVNFHITHLNNFINTFPSCSFYIPAQQPYHPTPRLSWSKSLGGVRHASRPRCRMVTGKSPRSLALWVGVLIKRGGWKLRSSKTASRNFTKYFSTSQSYLLLWIFWLHCMACRILVPWPRVEPRPLQGKRWPWESCLPPQSYFLSGALGSLGSKGMPAPIFLWHPSFPHSMAGQDPSRWSLTAALPHLCSGLSRPPRRWGWAAGREGTGGQQLCSRCFFPLISKLAALTSHGKNCLMSDETSGKRFLSTAFSPDLRVLGLF